MSADFWAGYLSGATGILIGNPLDLVKVDSKSIILSAPHVPDKWDSGVAAPVLGYGALNALLFVSYNRALILLDHNVLDPADLSRSSLYNLWTAGAIAGFATWIVSAPTELIKCRTQLSHNQLGSWAITKETWRQGGLRGLYYGGGVTSIRDAFGYGFYFWSYELSKRLTASEDDSDRQQAAKVLLCGGLAGVVTWASIFPLDVIKTRLQTQPSSCSISADQRPLILAGHPDRSEVPGPRLGAYKIARLAYQEEGTRVFFRGLGVCSLRAFIVNAVQWAVYEWTIRALQKA